jgi:hypothetical protein
MTDGKFAVLVGSNVGRAVRSELYLSERRLLTLSQTLWPYPQ